MKFEIITVIICMCIENAKSHNNLHTIDSLTPKQLWKHFAELSNIPRPSRYEEKVLNYLFEFARVRSLECYQDHGRNVLIKREGRHGGQGANPVLLQCHVDMVTEKNADNIHDFFKDPIVLVVRGDWVFADNTTLGADNGIGVAAMLALLDDDDDSNTNEPMPPLECLFTVEEETGLVGARLLDAKSLGITARNVLNLDTEEWGTVYVGCAGGGDSSITIPITRHNFLAYETTDDVTVSISGLKGGHSGICIHNIHGNAVQLMAHVAQRLLNGVPMSRLLNVVGGNKRNAIPREAQISLRVPTRHIARLQDLVSELHTQLVAEFGSSEPKLHLAMNLVSKDGSVEAVEGGGLEWSPMARESSDRLLTLLRMLPHGASTMSSTLKDPDGGALCETSNNVASVRPLVETTAVGTGTADGPSSYQIVCLTRSLFSPALDRLRDRIRRACIASGGECEQPESYPGWAPPDSTTASPLLRHVIEAVEEVSGQPAKVAAIHAGLECGLLVHRLGSIPDSAPLSPLSSGECPALDVVSFGPTILGAHTPKECVSVPSVGAFYQALCIVLRQLAVH